MSLWGDKEVVSGANSGTIELSNTTSGEVVGTGTDFVNDISAGDYIRVDETLFVVDTVTNANSLTVLPGYLGGTITAIGAANTYVVLQAPKSAAYTNSVYQQQLDALGNIANTNVNDSDIIFVDTNEAASSNNNLRGISTGGWTKYVTYYDQDGNQRYKVETLVAMKRTEGQAGDAEDVITANT